MGRSSEWYTKAYGSVLTRSMMKLRDSFAHSNAGPETKVWSYVILDYCKSFQCVCIKQEMLFSSSFFFIQTKEKHYCPLDAPIEFCFFLLDVCVYIIFVCMIDWYIKIYWMRLKQKCACDWVEERRSWKLRRMRWRAERAIMAMCVRFVAFSFYFGHKASNRVDVYPPMMNRW